ncbi:non-ribosomal peptide synthetase [Paenibacillus macquariensis]|uniref:Amino acid adenylation domain-containing protein n=1 Tax=Paenibacillus macquariensis TaxID=948756 RepID=A0ABY1K2M1_9BACL|nr:non-ribosomal peptide synthetase [Paenibacillus macquariensis]MEC0090200.1 non-ribosomal peptide synthetase [Paenibacillus macquariensis]OAB39573.1 hypothetical protein PMSM_00105 [Paenibacillus macquariensis subsp. macquariensis]SIR17255.1 amino acid adenylation domain-containing protein [Paenibacillus macquariensis]
MELNLDNFEILTQEEKRVIAEMNNTYKVYTERGTIPELFTRQASVAPERIAIKDMDSSMTYRELEQESNRIARILNRAGVEPGQLVVVMTERGMGLLTAVFGVLKAGGAYVPIDPNYPEKRIRYMLHDSACRVLVTDSANLEALIGFLPETVSVIVCLDHTSIQSDRYLVYQRADIESEDNGAWTCLASEQNLAYVIYTSGSTGEPKGVTISHEAVLNTLFWLQETFQLTETDVIAQKTSASFTDSVWEFFWPLIYGANISIIRSETVKDPRKLYEQLLKDEVSITQFVPAQMSLFLDEVKAEISGDPLPALKWVFNGGEALLVNMVRDWFDTFGNAKIANIYGMTESAIYATNFVIENRPAEGVLRIPLGRPISNTRVFILDHQGQLCPFNGKGEICIGGTGLTQGYWNKADLNEKAFTKHPATGENLYRTGDLGLLRSDGVLEYLGRKDDQVQIRGFRVELKEVERAVSDFHLVKETAVISEEDSYGVKSLLCYFTSSEIGLEVNDLLESLKTILPDYMIPSHFIELNEMPLTSNGKIDRKNLPKMEGRTTRTFEYAAPRNEKETVMARIWANILNKDENDIGIHDSFFEIGGTSISIVRLHRRIKQELGHDVTVADLFSYPTITAYFDHFENRNNGDDKLDQDLMSLLDQIESGSIDVSQSMNALNSLKEG